MSNHKNFYINGQWVAPSAANAFDVVNPSNEEVCATISLGSEADTNAAVAAARAAFQDWAFTPKPEKLALLHKLLEVYKARSEEMAQAMLQSSPIGESNAHEHFKHFQTPLVPFLPCLGIFFNWYLIAQLEKYGMALLGLYIGFVAAMYFGCSRFRANRRTSEYTCVPNTETESMMLRSYSLPLLERKT